ncbi:MAG: DEAD/DEAH box helicase family protein [Planctomycetes bacterium]|uniref:helicase C-terminal domain-containing protein n=1 Tax=Candidatus Wunengus sp. YC65 TaxID=3367701 RepID=UPI001D9E908D|nr:DEAD/DEAH box helicase family protein [Planctomycetota bacterium]
MKTTKWPVKDFIIPEAISSIRDAVEKTRGNEVFFVGRLNDDHLVADVDVYAMGNKHAVPAIIKEAKYGDVIIHNHPDGILEPSDADLEIASYLGSNGIGCYIVDNNVEYLYPVVKVPKKRTYEGLNFEELSAHFLSGGSFAKYLHQYEYRKPQVEMLKSVVTAFNEDKIAIIEAGTGTGKSLAYLVPAVFWSIKNKERVVISTHTINLQEQLIEKDIPILKKCCSLNFKSVLVKGRNNYICLRKVYNLRAEGGTLIEDKDRQQLNDLLEWAVKTRDGSKADLNFVPQDDVWEAIQSEADQCTRLKCRFYDDCFFYIARRNAASADVLVVNHYLLMADLVVRKEMKGYDTVAILPPFKKIIIDEAHRLEAVATANLGYTISKLRIIKLLGRLINLKDNRKGLLQYLKNKLRDVSSIHDNSIATKITDMINTEILDARQRLYDITQVIFDDISHTVSNYVVSEGLQKNRDEETKLRVTTSLISTDLWQDVIETGLKTLSVDILKFASLLKLLEDEIGGLSKTSLDVLSSVLIDISSCKMRLRLAANDLVFFITTNERSCKWMEVKRYRENPAVRFCAAPLSVSEDLKACLYDNYNTIILTSATLAINKNFKFFKDDIGLHQTPESRLSELILDSPFDFKKQVIIGIPTDISEPNESGYTSALEENILKTVEITEGRALILFTSYSLLDNLYKKLEPQITQLGYTCLKQGMDNRHSLLETFKKDKTSVLFATDSFWEGIDVKGDALECVILTRLPFKVPTEPIIEARAEAIERAGGDAFYNYSVPMAVIKFKQGFGRLIRSRDDRGVVIIFDSRVATKRYGKIFLQSLPDARCIKDKKEVVFREIVKFLA